METLHIGLIGNRNESVPAHRTIPPVLDLAAAYADMQAVAARLNQYV